jgi:hypothetical protein
MTYVTSHVFLPFFLSVSLRVPSARGWPCPGQPHVFLPLNASPWSYPDVPERRPLPGHCKKARNEWRPGVIRFLNEVLSPWNRGGLLWYVFGTRLFYSSSLFFFPRADHAPFGHPSVKRLRHLGVTLCRLSVRGAIICGSTAFTCPIPDCLTYVAGQPDGRLPARVARASRVFTAGLSVDPPVRRQGGLFLFRSVLVGRG